MRRKALTVGIAAMALSLTAACGSNDAPTVGGPATTAAPTQSASTPATSSETSSTSTSPSSTAPSTTTTTSAAAKNFTVGQCLGDRPAFTEVSCQSGHTFEVVAVIPNADNAGDLLKRSAAGSALCNEAGATYLGSGGFPVTRVDVAPLPTAGDPQAASRYVCVTSDYTPDLKKRNTATIGSAKGKLAGDGFYNYRFCLEKRASQTDDVKVVPCTSPHQSEATGGFLNGKPGQKFPGGAVITSNAMKYCTPVGQKFLGTKTRRDIIVSQNSGGTGPWSRGQMVTGCFVEVTSGTVTKSLRYILAKPLTSYR